MRSQVLAIRHCGVAAMLAAMAARIPHNSHGPHGSTLKMSYIRNQHPYWILWLTPLTKRSKFHLYSYVLRSRVVSAMLRLAVGKTLAAPGRFEALV